MLLQHDANEILLGSARSVYESSRMDELYFAPKCLKLISHFLMS